MPESTGEKYPPLTAEQEFLLKWARLIEDLASMLESHKAAYLEKSVHTYPIGASPTQMANAAFAVSLRFAASGLLRECEDAICALRIEEKLNLLQK